MVLNRPNRQEIMPSSDNSTDIALTTSRNSLPSEDPVSAKEPGRNKGKGNESFNYIPGWRFYVAGGALQFALFLVNFEITIVSTALVSISNDLHDFSQISWVVTAYLITYTAGLVIVAKLSDIFGRKQTYLTTLLIFTAFSGACGGAQTIVELIVFRALQGVGGGGLYAVAFVMIFELVPKKSYPIMVIMAVSLATLGNALGPIFGGLIASYTTWRWVFLINVPIGAAIITVAFLTVPKDFPFHGVALREARAKPKLSDIDFAGAFLMLLALALLIAGLNEAASNLVWVSSNVLSPIIVSGLAWAAFFICERWYGRSGSSIQPVLPWRFCRNRMVTGLVLNSFFTGAISITLIVLLPLRYQTTLGVGPLEAGVKLLPFDVLTAAGAAMTGIIAKNRRVAPLYVGMFGVFLQIAGLAALPAIPPSHTAVYGLQVITGLGAGLNIGLVTMLIPYVVDRSDLAVATAAGTQFRFLGSSVVISISTAVGNSIVKGRLSGVLTNEQIQGIFVSSANINLLPPEQQKTVRRQFVDSFNVEFRIVLGFAVASLLTIALLWKKKQILID
ncbi:drug resistance transporter [Xylariaceae sp. FL1272]|nr:drug resistance transporter [Xylariaceae sp. FL1272]